MSTLSGPVPRGLRLTFLVLTLGTLALAVAAAVKGVWLLVVIAGVFAVCNLGILWTTRTGAAIAGRAAGTGDSARTADAAGTAETAADPDRTDA